MIHTRLSDEQVCRRGEEIYENDLRDIVETPDNIGKLISIDVNTGDYAIADDILEASDLLRLKRPDAESYGIRIGYESAYAFGGTMSRRIRK